MTEKHYRIAVIPGDGIGKEVVPEGIRVLEAAGRMHGISFKWDEYPWSCEYRTKHGRMMPPDALQTIRHHDAIFFGACGSVTDGSMDYALADQRKKFRIGSENPRKTPVIHRLLERHRGSRVLVIGQYLDQLRKVGKELRAPLITGKTPNRDRQELYGLFKEGEIDLLLVSKVGNFAVDLPEANVLIQISGTFGSRQEEAQRLGRILRPNLNGAMSHFYSLVTRDTRDQEFAEKRQRFLTEQGYAYEIIDEGALG